MNIKNNKGITLIALVITIIVLLILAGVTINMMLGDDGIIKNAQAAKEANNKANEKEAIELAKAEVLLATYNKQTPMDVDELNEALGKTGEDIITEETYKESVAKVVDGVPIPVGFGYVEGTKKDTGLIIVDGYGNEFVWVPVDEILTSGTVNYEDNKVSLIHRDNDASDTLQLNGIPTGVADDYADMKESVNIYGGFYVGRYETSWTGSKVASVANVEAMTAATDLGSTWTDIYTDTTNKNEATWYGLYAKQKDLYNKESDSVVSGMIYGSQWGAIMDWMSKVPNPDSTLSDKLYITDSTGMGHYNSSTPIKTGSNSDYAVKNIYDLAGNYSEWSQQLSGSKNGRVRCGSAYNSISSFNRASYYDQRLQS